MKNVLENKTDNTSANGAVTQKLTRLSAEITKAAFSRTTLGVLQEFSSTAAILATLFAGLERGSGEFLAWTKNFLGTHHEA